MTEFEQREGRAPNNQDKAQARDLFVDYRNAESRVRIGDSISLSTIRGLGETRMTRDVFSHESRLSSLLELILNIPALLTCHCRRKPAATA